MFHVSKGEVMNMSRQTQSMHRELSLWPTEFEVFASWPTKGNAHGTLYVYLAIPYTNNIIATRRPRTINPVLKTRFK